MLLSSSLASHTCTAEWVMSNEYVKGQMWPYFIQHFKYPFKKNWMNVTAPYSAFAIVHSLLKFFQRNTAPINLSLHQANSINNQQPNILKTLLHYLKKWKIDKCGNDCCLCAGRLNGRSHSFSLEFFVLLFQDKRTYKL